MTNTKLLEQVQDLVLCLLGNVNTLAIDNDGEIWIGTDNGPTYFTAPSQYLMKLILMPKIF